MHTRILQQHLLTIHLAELQTCKDWIVFTMPEGTSVIQLVARIASDFDLLLGAKGNYHFINPINYVLMQVRY